MRAHRTAIALAAGLAALAIVVGATVSGSPLTVARTSVSAPYEAILEIPSRGTRLCQAQETLPAGTTAIRVQLLAITVGPRVAVEASAGGHRVTSGSVQAGWTGGAATIPVRRVLGTRRGVTVCFTTGPDAEAISVPGERPSAGVAATSDGQQVAGRMQIEYLRPAGGSWLAQARAIARRIGLGDAAGSGAIVLPLLLGMLAVVVLTSWLVLRGSEQSE